VIGEGRPYLSALVVLNRDSCTALSIDPDNLSTEMEQGLLERIAGRLDSFPGYARIRRLAVIREPWTIDNGLMTPTMKIRRNQILERYATVVSSLYQGH
jgi:long-chain acyl-CoA synthetase